MSNADSDPAAALRLGFQLERAAVAVFSVLVVLHCAAVLGFSARHGRLSIVPLYDDVAYLIDGLKRSVAFDQGGFLGMAQSFLDQPPHAPYSTLLATLGFSLIPNTKFASYALGSLWVLVFFALVAHLLRGLPLLSRIGIMTAALAVPLLAIVIGSFRPDPYWGLITGAVAVILAIGDFGRSTRTDMVLIGLLVGAAALSKPTGMPAGVTVMAAGFLGAATTALLCKTVAPTQALIKTLSMLLGVSVVVGPYVIVAWSDLLTYILDVMGKDSAVWRTDGSLEFQLAYYLKPDLALNMVGWLFYAGPVFLLACLWAVWRLQDRAFLGKALSVVATVLVSYAIPTASPVKSGFIGCLFYGTFISAALWSLAQTLRVRPIPGILAFMAGLAIFFGQWRPDVPYIAANGPHYDAMDKANRAVTPAILKVLEDTDNRGQPLTIYTSSPGPVFDATVQYEALLRGLRANFVGDYTNPTWPDILARAQASHVVVASEAGALGQGGSFSYPGIQYQNRLIATLRGDAGWHTLTTFVDEAGFKTIVFSRQIPRVGVELSFGTGFRTQEGPFPDLRLPTFHWMINNTATLTARKIGSRVESFGLQCESIANLNLSVVDATGRVLASRDLQARVGTGRFDTLNVPLDRDSGSPEVFILRVTSEIFPAGTWPGPVLCAVQAVSDEN
jgi:hypothetical protein